MMWQERIKMGDKFAADVFSELESMGFTVARNGTEHTHPEFIQRLRQSDDTTSLAIRYAPDGVAGIGDPLVTAYIEAKNSWAIEKNAYQNYIRLAINGCIVIVIFNIDDRWLWCDINELCLRPVLRSKWPIDEDGWICPRNDPDYENKRKTLKGSGTPFLPIDTASLREWDTFEMSLKSILLRGD